MLLVLLGLAVAGWRGWLWWQAQQQAATQAQTQREDALAARIDTLRRDQGAQSQRLRQAEATNRLLREELLGLGQRTALLDDSVRKLADPQRHGAQALRLDEVELLLSQGAQRLALSGDLAGAQRAYALAAGMLDGVDDPSYLDLRQTLAQERAALDALGADPKAIAAGRLDAFGATLRLPPVDPAAGAGRGQPWWRRAFSRVLQVRPSDRPGAATPVDRDAGYAALQLELALARTAIERRDETAYRAALTRMDAWLVRLWTDDDDAKAQRARLRALRALPLRLRLPTSGSALGQLRALRAAR